MYNLINEYIITKFIYKIVTRVVLVAVITFFPITLIYERLRQNFKMLHLFLKHYLKIAHLSKFSAIELYFPTLIFSICLLEPLSSLLGV
jgi:hypothetical protein